MTNYLFVLGNAPELAEEELTCVFSRKDFTPEAFKLLGGTVKVAVFFDLPIIDELIAGRKPGDRIIFGLSGNPTADQFRTIKEDLESRGFKARYIFPAKGENELSSVVVAKQQAVEIYQLEGITAKTIWVQDFEDWGKRDYGRPASSAHLGMLPPKVARMMVNITGLPNDNTTTILDPFCGVGTILAEAFTIGNSIIGSDLSTDQVQKTRKNLDWMEAKYNLFNYDARSISQKLPASSIDAIVTEPDLGKTGKEPNLAPLYSSCLEDWKKILKPGGKIVIALPFLVDVSQPGIIGIDKAKIMGYSLISGPFSYFRPQAQVRRNIYIFQLANNH